MFYRKLLTRAGLFLLGTTIYFQNCTKEKTRPTITCSRGFAEVAVQNINVG